MRDGPHKRLPWRECATLITLVAAFGLAMALSLHHDCTHPPPPVERPDPGTPRSTFCATADTGHPWLLSFAAAALAASAVLLSRRRTVVLVWSCVLIAVAAFVLAGLASGLESANTI